MKMDKSTGGLMRSTEATTGRVQRVYQIFKRK